MRKLRQSQVINNFFTLASIIIISVVLTLYVKYIVKDENEVLKEKVLPLACQKKNLTILKVYNQKLLNQSIKNLNQGFYILNGSFKKSKKIKSIAESFISLDELNFYFENSLGKVNKNNLDKYLTIDYKIVEKDKDDKTNIKRKSFYSGSILVNFRENENDIFKIFTDFRFYDKKLIEERINCIIKVYKNNVKRIK